GGGGGWGGSGCAGAAAGASAGAAATPSARRRWRCPALAVSSAAGWGVAEGPAGALLHHLEPEAGGVRVVLLEPGIELPRVREGQHPHRIRGHDRSQSRTGAWTQAWPRRRS